MKVVFVAGPFRAENGWEIEENVRRAERVALEVFRLGIMAFCPHTNTRHFQDTCEDSVFLDGGLEMLRRCDAVVLVDGWEKSSGTRTEIALAEKLGMPVFRPGMMEDVRIWNDGEI